MCGIAGALALRTAARRPCPTALSAVRDAMRRRGPDGEGFWSSDSGEVILAHRRLAIIDLDERSLQPMHSSDTGLSIVFNGEIYNYRELRQELARDHGASFRTESDTEVLLAMFAAFGPSMVHRLRGMFAFAIWDARARRLFLARDPYGIKPVYWACAEGIFYFASQVKALETVPAISRESDPAGLVGFYLFGSVPEPFTIRRAISALPAGCTMVVGDSEPHEPVRYASVPAVLAAEHQPPDDAPELVVAAAASDSVRAHLVADVEVGLFLSAGIDSGALAGLMRDNTDARIRGITLAFEELKGTDRDEAPLAAKVAAHYGIDHHVRVITQGEFAACADRILADMDQPTIDGVNSWFVSMAAAETGLKVVLSGLGGDELLAGYDSFTAVPKLARVGRNLRLARPATGLAKFLIQRLAPGLLTRNPKLIGLFDLDGGLPSAYLLRRALLLPFELERALDPDTVREGLVRLDPMGLISSALDPMPSGELRQVSALESSLYMRNQLLRDSDWASMAHSLELRVPLVDWPTLQRIAPIQPHLAGGRGKLALANAPSRALPSESIVRPRSGFSIPVGTWSGMTGVATGRLGSRFWSSRVAESFAIGQYAAERRQAA